MKNAYSAMVSLGESWARLKTKYGEIDLGPWAPGLTVADFDSLISDLTKTLESAAESTKRVNRSGEWAAEFMFVKNINEAQKQVDTAIGNQNVAWLIQASPFIAKLAEAQALILPFLHNRFKVRKDLIEFAKSEFSQNLIYIEDAVPQIKEMVEHRDSINECAGGMEDLQRQASEARQEAEQHAFAINESLEAAVKAVEQIEVLKTESAENVKSAVDLVATARAEIEEVAKYRKDGNEALVKGREVFVQATRKLEKALADINRQALADSFATKASSLNVERILWIGAFAISMGWLVWCAFHVNGMLVAATKVGGDNSLTTNLPSIWVQLIHALPFVIPGVWIGWLSARNAGLTARVQQDYSYKVATALAFQGYRNEVANLGDQELQAKLMELAITNFGANPIRIYDGIDELGHPLEALRSVLKDDKLFERFLDFLKLNQSKSKPA